MKYLVLVLVIAVVIWLARSAREKTAEPPAARRKPAGSRRGDKVMLTCAHCGVHLPADEALPGRGGVFCSEEHRAIVESRHGTG
jgi:uncharacterized protein